MSESTSSGLRVAVTGATGNVGLAVVRALVAEPRVARVVGIAPRAPQPGAMPFDETRVLWRAADVGTDDLSEVFDGVDAVVHLAWRFQPTRQRAVTWRTNVIGTERVLEAAARAGVDTIVYASSVGAYSPVAGRPFAGPAGEPLADPDQRVDEAWPTRALPTAAYGIEKSYLERALDVFEARHERVRAVRIRSAFVFQRTAAREQLRIFGGRLAPGRLVASGRIPVLPLPAGLRLQAIHADDLADAYVRALLRPVRGAFNVAAEPVVGPDQLGVLFDARVVEVPPALVGRALAVAFGLHIVPVEPGLLQLFMTLPVMDASRARRELDWAPRHSSIDALRELLTGLGDPPDAPTPALAAPEL